VLSGFQQGMTEISAEELLDLKHWQKIQDLLAEIIGVNLWFIDAQGIPLFHPSKICTYCSDVNSSSYTSSKLSDCALKAYQILNQKNELFYQCPHSLTYFLVPLKQRVRTLAFIIGGPFILGKKETHEHYKLVCQKLEIDFDHFLDWIRELKSFSHHGINLVVHFLKELSYFIWPVKAEPFQTEGFVKQNADFLANSLLEIASQIVGADSGSVLLVDPAKKSFFIQSSHGLNAQVLKKRTIPFRRGIAGWVVENKKAVLISPQSISVIPKLKLKRPYIKSSMIVPLQFQDRIYGVFCLNSKTENDRFNERNLLFLNHLGKIATAALSRSSLN